MNFTTVFDIVNQHPDYSLSLKPVAFFCAGVITIIFTLQRRKQNKVHKKFFFMGIGFVLFSLFWFVTIAGTRYYSIRSSQKAFLNKEYLIVEGQVENYRPMPEQGHASEEFDVKNVHFKFSDYELGSLGYNNSASHGGVIKEGLYVRIAYMPIDFINPILRLEISK
jgi:hypothetical protein